MQQLDAVLQHRGQVVQDHLAQRYKRHHMLAVVIWLG